nr:hypothetical protein [Acidimicrobiia bacterium]
MGAVWYRARAEVRRRWAATLVLALLVGLAGGAVLTAAAGARRTASAYPRFLEASRAGDVLVNPNDGNTDFDAIEALPQVEAAARADGLFIVHRLADGSPDFNTDLISLASQGSFGYELDRPVGLDGRLPRPDALEEVALSTILADDLGLDVGDRFPLLRFAGETAPPEPLDVTVTGVGRFPFDALQDEQTRDTFPVMFFGPAAARAWANPEENFRASLVQLRGGDEERGDFLAAAQRIAGEQLFLQTQAETTASAQRSLRPYAGALGLFAAVAAMAGLLVVGQALVRHLLSDAGDTVTLGSLGVDRRQFLAGTVLRAGVVGVLGAVVA